MLKHVLMILSVVCFSASATAAQQTNQNDVKMNACVKWAEKVTGYSVMPTMDKTKMEQMQKKQDAFQQRMEECLNRH